MPTQDSIVAQMRMALQMAEPTLDTSIGSPIRSILDAVGEVVAEQTADQYLLNYQYDIDTKSGADLDSFVQLFGMARYPAKYASAYVTFTMAAPAITPVNLGQGLQISTSTSPTLAFATIISATIPVGGTSVTVPALCSVTGTVGNVAANTITRNISPTMGVATITNASPASGGADQESDDQLRARFKTTVFRNLAGTEGMFRAIALDDQNVSQTNVLGSSKNVLDQIQMNTVTVGGSPVTYGVSSVQDLRYYYTGTDYIGANLSAGNIVPRTQYTVASNYIPNPEAPGLAAGSTSTPNLPIGTYYYALVYETLINGATYLYTGLGEQLSITLLSAHKVTVTWNASSLPSSVTKVHIYRKVGETFVKVTEATPSAGTYTDDGTLASPTSTPPLHNTTGAPVVTSTDTTHFSNGVYDFRFDYLSDISRNDPVSNITNKVDIYVNGNRDASASENVSYSTDLSFDNSQPTAVSAIMSSPPSMNPTLFRRLDGDYPNVGNYFTQLNYSPITSITSIANLTHPLQQFVKGVDYWVVNEADQFGMSNHSRAGIEWISTGTHPTLGDRLTVTYTYNQIPADIETQLQAWRLVTTDVMIHEAISIPLDVYLGIVLVGSGYSPGTVISAIQTAVSNYLTNISFDGIVQLSAILSVIQQVPGVAAVRFLTSADTNSVLYGTGPMNGVTVGTGVTAHYGIQRISTANQATANTTLSSALVNTTNTSITVSSHTGFPATSGYAIQIGNEQMWVTAGAGTTTWTVIRKYNGSTPASALNGAGVTLLSNSVENFASYDGATWRATDVFLDDNELAVLNNVYISQMSSINFKGV